MSFIGQIQNGQVVVSNPIPLANGTRVRVEQFDELSLTPFGTPKLSRSKEQVIAVFEALQSRNSLGDLKLRELIEEGRP